MLIVYSVIAQLSPLRLFAAAIFPGLMLAGLYISYTMITSRMNIQRIVIRVSIATVWPVSIADILVIIVERYLTRQRMHVYVFNIKLDGFACLKFLCTVCISRRFPTYMIIKCNSSISRCTSHFLLSLICFGHVMLVVEWANRINESSQWKPVCHNHHHDWNIQLSLQNYILAIRP